MLRPEKQDMEIFVEGMDNIVTAQRNAARLYFEDGTIELACPPLKALLHIMAEGTCENRDVHDPSIRQLFTPDALYTSEWYQMRLEAKQRYDVRQAARFARRIQAFRANDIYSAAWERLGTDALLEEARSGEKYCETPEHASSLVGTIGLDPATLPE